jgi:hypothetical protein
MIRSAGETCFKTRLMRTMKAGVMGKNVLKSGKNQTKIEVNPCICDTHFVCDDRSKFPK